MDPEELSRLQDSGSRIRCGGVTGLIAGFRVSRGMGTLRLLDGAGVEHEVGGAYEVVDEVDDKKVEKVRKDRDDEDDRVLAGTQVGAMRAEARAKRQGGS
jgi:hypothetical protein